MSEKTKKEKGADSALRARRVVCYIVLIIITFLCLFSFYILLINSTHENSAIQKGFHALPGGYFFKNMNHLMSDANLPVIRALINSFIVAGLSAVVSVYFSALTAYAIHAYDFKGKGPIFAFILMIMMVPTQVSALGFVKEVKAFHMYNTFWPLILPSIAAPIVFFFMKQYMESALPLEIVEAARIDGSNEFNTFNAIVLPIMKPAFAVQAIFTFTSSWNNYFLPSLLLDKKNVKTLPIIIAMLRGADFLKFDMGKVYACILVAIFPVLIVYLCLSKYIIQGIALGSVKG